MIATMMTMILTKKIDKQIRNYWVIIFFGISVRVFDRWTCNQTCFNAARALKPLNNGEAKLVCGVDLPLGSKVPGCDFCSPLDHTAAGTMCVPCFHVLYKRIQEVLLSACSGMKKV